MPIKSIRSALFGGSSHGLRQQDASGFFPKWLQGEGFLSSRKQQYNPSGWRRLLNWFKGLKRKYSIYKQVKHWAPSLFGAGAIATLAAAFGKPAKEAMGRLFNQPVEIAPILGAVGQHMDSSPSSDKEKAVVGYLGKIANKITYTLVGVGAVASAVYFGRGWIGKMINGWTDNVAQRNLAVIAKEFKDPASEINTAFHGTVKRQVQDMLQDPGVKQDAAGLVTNAVQNTLDHKGVQASLQNAAHTALMGEKAKTVSQLLQNACSKKEERGIAIQLLNRNAEINRINTTFTEHSLQKEDNSTPVQSIISNKLETAIREDAPRTGDNTLKKSLESKNTEWLENNIAKQFKAINADALNALPQETQNAVKAINAHFLSASFLERKALLNDIERVLPKDPKKLKELGISTHFTATHAHNPHNAFVEAFNVAKSPPQEAISGGLLNNPDTKKQFSRLATDIAIDTVGNPSVQHRVNVLAQNARKSVSFVQWEFADPIKDMEEACLEDKTKEIALQLCRQSARLKQAGTPDNTAIEAITYNFLRKKHPGYSNERTEFILSKEIETYLNDKPHGAELQTWLNQKNQKWLEEEIVNKLKLITPDSQLSPNGRKALAEIEANFSKASYEDRKALLDDFKTVALEKDPNLEHDINHVLQNHIKNPHNELLAGFEKKLGKFKPGSQADPEQRTPIGAFPETSEEAVSETGTSTTTTNGETSGTQAPQQNSGFWSYVQGLRR